MTEAQVLRAVIKTMKMEPYVRHIRGTLKWYFTINFGEKPTTDEETLNLD